jgi:hypothetical protein
MLVLAAIDRGDDQAGQHTGRRTGKLARGVFIAALLGALAVGAAPSAAEQGESGSGAATREPTGDGWEFEVSPYAWFTFLPGTLTFRDQAAAPIDLKFDDIWRQLHFAFFLDTDIRKDDFGFFSDLTYAYLWARSQGPAANYKTDVYLVIFDFALYWEALKLDLGSGPSAPRLRLQPLIGGRYFYSGLNVRRDAPLDTRFFEPTLSTAAPVLGVRGFLDVGEHWNLSFVGDGGGFGVDGMNHTWQAELLGGYRFHYFSKLDLNLMIGYKGLGIDHSGVAVEADLIMHGPVLRFGCEF